MRPLVRFDGIYYLKLKYFRTGISETSEYRPVHEVISYRYIRFLKDGSTMSIFSTKTPKKIFEKLRVYFLTGGKSNNHELFEMQRGQFWMQNNMITLLVQSGHNGEHYRYDFQANRMSALPEYLRDKGDFLE